MRIAIFGLGYVGLTAAACLAKDGHHVLGIDINESKVRDINAGRSPITEPGVEDLLQAAIRDGLLTATNNASKMINECDLAMVCVGTPSAPDGSHNLSYIAEVSRQIACSIPPERATPLTVVYRSTVRPGTTENVIGPIFRTILGKASNAVELVYNPEFLREAVAVRDYFAPPKIVVGTADGRPNRRMAELNKSIVAPVFYTTYREAEITKFVDNSFHALKVAFGNEIGRLCLELGISAAKVHEIFVSDTKLNISPRYLRPGGAFGGSCLPKDIRALQHMADDLGAVTPVIDGLIRSNEAHKDFIFEHLVRGLPPRASVLMLGLSFKANSDDLRESPKVDLARKLLQHGYRLAVYEPTLNPARLIGQNLGYSLSHLPDLSDLLVSRDNAEQQIYDLVIDTNGIAETLHLSTPNVIDIYTFA